MSTESVNARLGVTGGFSELFGKLSRGSVRFDWRGWFAIGVALGGTVFAPLHADRRGLRRLAVPARWRDRDRAGG